VTLPILIVPSGFVASRSHDTSATHESPASAFVMKVEIICGPLFWANMFTSRMNWPAKVVIGYGPAPIRDSVTRPTIPGLIEPWTSPRSPKKTKSIEPESAPTNMMFVLTAPEMRTRLCAPPWSVIPTKPESVTRPGPRTIAPWISAET
jgi:hypothetical protein